MHACDWNACWDLKLNPLDVKLQEEATDQREIKILTEKAKTSPFTYDTGTSMSAFIKLWSICGVSFRAVSPASHCGTCTFMCVWDRSYKILIIKREQYSSLLLAFTCTLLSSTASTIFLSYLHSPAPSSPLQPVPDQCEWDLLNPIPLQWLGLHRVHRTGSCTPSSPKWLLSPQWYLSQWTVSRWLTHQHSCYCQKCEKHHFFNLKWYT